MIKLDDCGRELSLRFTYHHSASVKVIMVIKAPRGTLTIFGNDPHYIEDRCGGIRAFMEEYR